MIRERLFMILTPGVIREKLFKILTPGINDNRETIHDLDAWCDKRETQHTALIVLSVLFDII